MVPISSDLSDGETLAARIPPNATDIRYDAIAADGSRSETKVVQSKAAFAESVEKFLASYGKGIVYVSWRLENVAA